MRRVNSGKDMTYRFFKIPAIESQIYFRKFSGSRDVQIGGSQGHSTEHVVMKQYINQIKFIRDTMYMSNNCKKNFV